jgi:thymidine kinase
MKFTSLRKTLNKKFKTIQLNDIWGELLEEFEPFGMWLIYGGEKMGKTTLSLSLAKSFTEFKRTLYIQAEQGLDKDFQKVLGRIFDSKSKNILLSDYINIENLKEALGRRNQADVIFIDNLTIYSDELRVPDLKNLIETYPNKLFIFIAHEEDGKPYTAIAKKIKKLSKRVIKIEGHAAFIEGRVKNKKIAIDIKDAMIYHGTL